MNREDFLDTTIGNNPNFKWKEALYLESLNVYVIPDEVTENNIMATANKMQAIRDIIEKPIVVTSWYRPAKYSKLIGSTEKSPHVKGLACDFYVRGMLSDAVRELLLEFLEPLDICMENLPKASWVHIDLMPPRKNTGRFFIP